jgi:adenine-specific DNA-methyltransferase
MKKSKAASNILSSIKKGDLSGFGGFGDTFIDAEFKSSKVDLSKTSSEDSFQVGTTVKLPVPPIVSFDLVIRDGQVSVLDIDFVTKFLTTCDPSKLSSIEKREVLDVLLYQYIRGTAFETNKNVTIALFGVSGFCVNLTKHIKLMTLLEAYTFSIKDRTEEGYVSFDALCKIFEMFIPSDIDDEDGDVKKSTGSVYTPKDIAYFMSVDVLVSYLRSFNLPLHLEDTLFHALASVPDSVEVSIFTGLEKEAVEALSKVDQLLETVKILEPSIGAGAFAHSMLVVLVNLRQGIARLIAELEDIPRSNDFFIKYDTDLLKKHILETNLYGADINKDAIEMSRKRLLVSFLSDAAPSVEDLPNIEFNILVGNALLEGVNTRPLVPTSFNFNKQDLSGLENAKLQFKKSSQEDKTRSLTLVVKELKQLLLKLGVTQFDSIEIESIETYEEFESIFKKAFSFELMFSELFTGFTDGLFDIVIGNPPYVRATRITGIKDDLSTKYEVYHGSADILVYFYEQGYNLLKEGGILSFITSNKWLISKYGEPLRKFVSEKTELLLLLDFKANHVFKGVGVDTEITVFRKPKIVNGVTQISGDLIYCSGEEYKVQE